MTTAVPTKCEHCDEYPVVQHLHPKVVGARPVTLALCGCDWPRCSACKKAIRDVKAPTRCPHCGANAFAKS